MRVAILGTLEVSQDDRIVPISGGRLRSLLCRLAVAAPRTVPIGELLDSVWGETMPADAANALQTLVSRLRRALGSTDLVVQQANGYRLDLSPEDLDVGHFRRLVAQARQASREQRWPTALADYEAALALWRGDPLTDVAETGYARGLAVDLQSLRLDACTGRFAAALELDRGAEIVPDLARMVEDHPLHEELAAQLIGALAQAGRGGEAVDAYERVRRTLADHLGTDPGPDLQRLHLALLRGELPTTSRPGRPRRGVASNIGEPMTSFVGRDAELARIAASLARNRLTTIVGPGGAGKTRLATESARRWMGDHGRSAWLTELAPVSSEAQLASALLGSLGLRDVRTLDRSDRPNQDDHRRLLDALRDTDYLLVIDNCEHLISGVAELVAELVGAAPQVRILATSREPLGLTGEALAPIPPLRWPSGDCTPAEALGFPAVELFVDRGAAVSPDFVLTEDNLADVLTIVRRLDGLPLAIELAVARLRVLPVHEIAERLSDRFRLLTGGNRTSLPRHRTLRAVVDWSWGLLTDPERRLAERIAVFPAGVTETSAAAVCADPDPGPDPHPGSDPGNRLAADEVSALLITLAEKSLLQLQPTSPVRYRMLETIREYGIERLAEQGLLEEARTAHADYFADLIIELEPMLRGPDQLEALTRFRAENDNIAAARQYLLDSRQLHTALMMTLAQCWLTLLTSDNRDVASWLDQLIAAHDGVDEPYLPYAQAVRMMVGLSEGGDHLTWTDLRSSIAAAYHALADAPPPPFPTLAGVVAVLPLFGGLEQEAAAARATALASPDAWVRGVVHASTASWAENEGDSEQVREEIRLAEAEFERSGDSWGRGTVLATQAQLKLLDGDLAGAVADLRAALVITAQLGSTDDVGFLRLRLAGALAQLGRTDEARAELDALRQLEDLPGLRGDEGLIVDAMRATIAWADGREEEGLRRVAALRLLVSERYSDGMMFGHGATIALSTAAAITADHARTDPTQLAVAVADLGRAYPYAVATEDLPLLAALGPGLADVAEQLGRSADAVEVLGAAARLRGGDAVNEPLTQALIRSLRAALGAGFETHYARGRNLDRPGAIARMDPGRLTSRSTERATAQARRR